ncbi:uncharacterized protein ATC70_012644 [Mucor velutinosus]|uniref:C2H2-type domain-containing protein n=1 Tax=Mucor velutinosus TaxID=708070 RepID=A0AAN7HKM9_9FUNG|nr:hypothetical protein ATC70_012644 [Mucor velutinosus]
MVYSKEYKQKIAFEYPCYICGSVLSKARQTINHLENIHGYKINGRSVGRRRPENPNFVYINDPKKRTDFEVYHCSCPSCWFHCSCDENALTALANHINEFHNPQNVDPGKNENGLIRAPQVNYVSRSKILPVDSDGEETDGLESEEEEETNKQPPKTKAKAQPKNKKKDTNQLGINDIYQRVVDLTEMFKALMNNDNNKQQG